MSDITKSVIAVLCLSASFAGWGMEGLFPSPGAGGARPFRPRCELKHIGPAPAAAVAVSPLRSNGLRKAAGVVAQDWFEKAKATLMKRGEVHTNVVDVLGRKCYTGPTVVKGGTLRRYILTLLNFTIRLDDFRG